MAEQESRRSGLHELVESAVRHALARVGFPTRKDLDALHERIAALEAKMAHLTEDHAAQAGAEGRPHA